ncbi:MAG: hypothetical protein AABX37_03710, partial [Nanoarchaeota archaeon]
MPQTKTNSLILNIFLLVGTILVFIILLELSLRLFYPMKISATEPDALLGFRNIPQWEGYYRNAQFLQTEYFVKTTHNSLGLNNKELDIQPLSEQNVILIVGDSFTYGAGVSQEQAFPQITQKLLGEQYTVINAGTPGYDLSQYLAFIKQKSSFYHPDMIVIGLFVGNDLGKQSLYKLDKNNGLIAKERAASSQRRILSTCTRNSHACTFIANAIAHSSVGDFLREQGILQKDVFSLNQQEEYS